MRFQRYDCSGGCPVEAALETIAGKWKGIVLVQLLDGTKRFNALQRAAGDVAPRTLAKQLRELEADGLVSRKVFATVPPRVDYSLTEKGAALEPILSGLAHWGRAHLRGSAPTPSPTGAHT